MKLASCKSALNQALRLPVPNIKGMGLLVSNKKIFKGFSLQGSMYNVTPRTGPILIPGL